MIREPERPVVRFFAVDSGAKGTKGGRGWTFLRFSMTFGGGVAGVLKKASSSVVL